MGQRFVCNLCQKPHRWLKKNVCFACWMDRDDVKSGEVIRVMREYIRMLVMEKRLYERKTKARYRKYGVYYRKGRMKYKTITAEWMVKNWSDASFMQRSYLVGGRFIDIPKRVCCITEKRACERCERKDRAVIMCKYNKDGQKIQGDVGQLPDSHDRRGIRH